jgi:chemotaxis protein CheX
VEFTKKIAETTEEIFSTMLFMEVAPQPPLAAEKQVLDCQVSAMIGLTGGFTAMLGVHCPTQVGLSIAGAMLGLELDEIDADVKDALGEIANMLAGGLKERFSQENIALNLAIPTAIAGKSYTIAAPSGSSRVVVPFIIEPGQFFIEIKYHLA